MERVNRDFITWLRRIFIKKFITLKYLEKSKLTRSYFKLLIKYILSYHDYKNIRFRESTSTSFIERQKYPAIICTKNGKNIGIEYEYEHEIYTETSPTGRDYVEHYDELYLFSNGNINYHDKIRFTKYFFRHNLNILITTKLIDYILDSNKLLMKCVTYVRDNQEQFNINVIKGLNRDVKKLIMSKKYL